MKIVVLYKSKSGCDYHRLVLPYSNFPIGEGDSVVMVENMGVLRPELLIDADYVIYNRVSPFDLDILLNWRKLEGFRYKLVCDIDDYWYLNPSHEYFEIWKKIQHSEKIEDHIKLSDIVTVTHERLAEKMRPLNSNVTVFPNALPFDEGQFLKKPKESLRTTIVYTGGTSHYGDLKLIQRPIEKIKYLPIDFVIAGFNQKNEATANFWIRVNNIFRNNPNVFMKQSLPLTSYMEHLNIADVTIAPLEETSFSWGKSPLKIIESGCKNLPIICSDTFPYSEWRGIEGVYICRNTKEWTDTFFELSKNPESFRKSGEALGRYVRENFSIEKINNKRLEYFKQKN